MSDQAWYEHFKDKLQGLSTKSDSNLSLLGQALKENLLSNAEYLRWASNHFGLPQIKTEFFTDNKFPQELYSKWATQYTWTSDCLPVAEWDGTLIVACLQPPQDFPKQLIPASFVLASWQDLNSYYVHIQKETQSSAPEGFELAAKVAVEPKASLQFSAENLFGDSEVTPEAETSEEANELVADASEEMPVGLFSTEDIAPNILEVKPNIPPPPQNTASILQPTAAKLPPPPPPEALILLPQDEALMTPVQSIRIPDADLPEEVSSPLIEIAGADEVPEDTISQLIPLEEEEPSAVVETQKKPAISAAHVTFNGQITTKFALERYKKKHQELTKKIESSFGEMKNYFEKVMLLAVDDEQSVILPFVWDDNFKGIKALNSAVPLNVPSIFNIVSSTQKSFHGYISINEVNEKFFDDWNQNSIPDHVTISPIVEGELVIGMLMGVGSKKSYTRTTLNVTERLALGLMTDTKMTSKAA